jgi:hypothetical protein
VRWSILSLVFVANLAWADTGSGDQLAHPPTVILSEIWLYNQVTPVYQVNIEHAGETAVLQAVQAAIASVHPEFTTLTPSLAAAAENYVVARTDLGTRTTIYIRRTIIADWLIAG